MLSSTAARPYSLTAPLPYSRGLRACGQVRVVLLDCGTGLHDPAARAALALSDQILLVTNAEPSTASLVAEAATLVAASGLPMTLVVNKLARGHTQLDLARFGSHVPSAEATVTLPAEAEAASRLASGTFAQLTVVLTLRLMQLRRLVIGEVGRFPELARVLYESGPRQPCPNGTLRSGCTGDLVS